jgi:hypothetical protein
LVLDHLIVESMDSATIDKSELSSIIRYGAEAIFEEDENAVDAADLMKFQDEDIDKLVDRVALVKEEKVAQEAEEAAEAAKLAGQIADDPEGKQKPGSFAFAKVWTLDKDVVDAEAASIATDTVMNNTSAAASSMDLLGGGEANVEQQEEFWEKLLKDSDEPEVDEGPVALGKRRARTRVNYSETSKRVKKAIQNAGESEEDEYEPVEDSGEESAHEEEGPHSPVFDPSGSRKGSKAVMQPYQRAAPQTSAYPHQDSQPRQTDDFSCWICGPDSYYHTPLQCPMIFDEQYLKQLKKKLEDDYSEEKVKIRMLGAMLRMSEQAKREWVQIPPDDGFPPVGLSGYLDTAPATCLFCGQPYHSFSNCPRIFSDPHGTIVRLNELEGSGVIPGELAGNMRGIVRQNMAPPAPKKSSSGFGMSSLLGGPRDTGNYSNSYEQQPVGGYEREYGSGYGSASGYGAPPSQYCGTYGSGEPSGRYGSGAPSQYGYVTGTAPSQNYGGGYASNTYAQPSSSYGAPPGDSRYESYTRPGGDALPPMVGYAQNQAPTNAQYPPVTNAQYPPVTNAPYTAPPATNAPYYPNYAR